MCCWLRIYIDVFFSSSQPEKQILFVIQALVEITVLFDDAVVPWDAKKLEDFLDVVHEEIDGLHSCVSTVCVYCMFNTSSIKPEELIDFSLNAGGLQNEEEQKAASVFWKTETHGRNEHGEIWIYRWILSCECVNSSKDGLTVVLLFQEDRDHSWEIVRKRVISFMNQLEFFSFHTHV